MPTPTNISPTTALALTVNTPYTIVVADIQLAPNGTGYTSNCVVNNPQKNALWFKYTIPSGVKYFSFGIKGIPFGSTYDPYTNIWTQTSPGVYTQYKVYSNQYCNKLISIPPWYSSFLVLGNTGDTYYFQIQASGVIDHDLIVLVTHASSGVGIAGDILITDDLGPYPTAIIRPATQRLIGYLAYDKFWTSEDFSVIQQGGWIANGVHENTPGNVLMGKACRCFGPPPNFDLISTVDLSAWCSSNASFRDVEGDQIGKHYAITGGPGSIDYIHKIDAITGIRESTFPIPGRIGVLIGVHTASGIVYYTDYNNYSTVHRMNINTGAALTDFLPDSGMYRAEGFVLPNGTVGISTQDAIFKWDIYNSSGVLINSFDREYHRFSLDNNLTGIWFWENNKANFSHAMIASLGTDNQNITIPDPVQVFSGGPMGPEYDDLHWGYSDSCPVLVYPLGGVPPPPAEISGLYYINPTGSHDKYYNDVEKKIPDPTAKTAVLGE